MSFAADKNRPYFEGEWSYKDGTFYCNERPVLKFCEEANSALFRGQAEQILEFLKAAHRLNIRNMGKLPQVSISIPDKEVKDHATGHSYAKLEVDRDDGKEARADMSLGYHGDRLYARLFAPFKLEDNDKNAKVPVQFVDWNAVDD
jgi:hypothetical protein